MGSGWATGPIVYLLDRQPAGPASGQLCYQVYYLVCILVAKA